MGKTKNVKQAPLSFVGQKRQFLHHFKRVLEENIPEQGEGWTIVDVFGGSGLLAHTAKRAKPLATVIYNDFDGYAERLKHIPEINRLRQQIAKALEGETKRKPITHTKKSEIIQLIEAFEGYKDPHTLCAWLLFSGKQAKTLKEFYQKSFWHRVPQRDYSDATDYLEGIEVVCEPFHTLLPRFQPQEKVLLLLDPPYLCTRQDSYKQANYFDLIDFLRLIDLTKPPYLFFSSTKSKFIRFIHYMVEAKRDGWQNFEGAERIVVKATTSYSNCCEDNLVYKF